MEDPMTFAPSPALVEHHIMPGGPYVRVDTALYPGYKVSSHYDSLGSKLIVWGEDRETCLRNVQHALKEYIITGPQNLIPLFKRLAVHPDVLSGNLSIKWLDENIAEINKEPYK
jgi:acetyl-CoA carboxylase biotin carboxylase subunit